MAGAVFYYDFNPSFAYIAAHRVDDGLPGARWQAVKDATSAAIGLGVFGVPTVQVGDELFWGDDRLEEAAAALGAAGG
jgi:hypothetical protein